MGDKLIMSAKERKRKVILEDVKKGLLTLKDASPKLEVCYRQSKRIWQRYLKYGDVGLVHISRGRKSSHSYPESFRKKVLDIYRSKYMDFGPTFASEKLEEIDGIKINAETLRLWLLEAKLWYRHRKRKSYRQRRERRQSFGELLQIDGSDHAWFGKEHPRSCLLNMVDDATGRTLSQMDTGETCKVLLATFKMWVEKHGVPKAVYVDLKSLYVSPKSTDVKKTFTVFERVCYLLNVKIIKAYSPQAKGRVERNHGTYQDRFVKELQLRGIKDIASANKLLNNYYLDKVNGKFAKSPVSKTDAHCSAKAYGDLEQIFCWAYTRTLQNDFTVHFENECYQLRKQQPIELRKQQKIIVHVHLDGKISFWHKGHKLKYKKTVEPAKKAKAKKLPLSPCQISAIAKANKHKTPWGKYNPGWLRNATA